MDYRRAGRIRSSWGRALVKEYSIQSLTSLFDVPPMSRRTHERSDRHRGPIRAPRLDGVAPGKQYWRSLEELAETASSASSCTASSRRRPPSGSTRWAAAASSS